MSNNLQWSKHLEELEDDLSFRLYNIRKLEQSFPKSLLKRVADAIFNSAIRYGLGIFCPIRRFENDPIPTCINGIRVLFNDLLRLLCNSKRSQHESTKSMLDKVGWLSINQLACEIRLIETWKAVYLEDYCLNEVFERVDSRISPRTQNQIRLKSKFKTKIRETSFQFPSVQLWNSAPIEITEAQTETQARAAIRRYVKEHIPI